jgi:hypothetical protein
MVQYVHKEKKNKETNCGSAFFLEGIPEPMCGSSPSQFTQLNMHKIKKHKGHTMNIGKILQLMTFVMSKHNPQETQVRDNKRHGCVGFFEK